MKIASVRTFVIDCFRTNWVFVKVETDEGISGIGEGTLEYKENALVGALEEGCKAMKDLGIRIMECSYGPRYRYDGVRTRLPYGHGMRIENFRKPETAVYWRPGGGDDISVSACGYNHLLPDQVKITRGTYNWLHDKATGCNFMTFGCGAPCLNLYRLEDIPARMNQVIGNEYLIHATHEEYWYKDYFAYQPDSREKLMTACKMVHEADYQYFFIEDKVDW